MVEKLKVVSTPILVALSFVVEQVVVPDPMRQGQGKLAMKVTATLPAGSFVPMGVKALITLACEQSGTRYTVADTSPVAIDIFAGDKDTEPCVRLIAQGGIYDCEAVQGSSLSVAG